MSEPFLGEIRMVGFNFAPRQFAFCDGQILPINQNQSLYSILGTTYGGDGRTSFALPDLRGRAPMHVSSSHGQGQKGGQETSTLTVAEMPAHAHGVRASSADGDSPLPTGNVLASVPGADLYAADSPTDMNAAMVGNVGGGQAHENRQPWLALNFIIALQGLFPPRN